MTTDNLVFHDPLDIGLFDLTPVQVDKDISFEWDTAVIPEAKVVAYNGLAVVKTYVVGDGLTLSNSDRNVTLRLNGSDFSDFLNKKALVFKCNFFVENDVEVTFKLRIVQGF